MSTETLGENLRKLREKQALPLRKVAALADIDAAILSKIERGQRKATREQVIRLAACFQVNKNGLLLTWLSDKIAYQLEDEDMALLALQVAEEKVKYMTINRKN